MQKSADNFSKNQPGPKSPVSDPQDQKNRLIKKLMAGVSIMSVMLNIISTIRIINPLLYTTGYQLYLSKLKYLRDDVEPVKRRHRQQIEHHEHYVYGHYVIYHKIERFRHPEHDAVCLADYQLEYQRGYESDHKIRCNTCQRRKKSSSLLLCL